MLKLIPILVVVLGTAAASRSADQYFDSVIHAVGQELRNLGLDPAPLSNFNVRFGPQALAEAQFTRGNVTNLNQIRRKGACQGPKTVRGENTINCTLSLYPVLTQHQVYIRNGSAAYSLRSQGNVAESLIFVAISGQAGGYPGSVKNYRVERVGQITVKFAQFPTALNKYAKVLGDTYRNQVSTELFNILQQRYVYAIGRAVSNKPMPQQ